MNVLTIVLIVTSIVGHCYAQNINLPQETCQGTLDQLISELNGAQQETESSACACACSSAGTSWKGPPPTVHIDMSSLLSTAVQKEVQTQNEQIIFRLGQEKQAENVKFFNKTSLDIIKLGSKNYFFSKKQQMSWIDAASFCRFYNMDLVSVETKEEDEMILQHLRSIGLGNESSGVYTSGNQIGSNTFIWAHGTPLGYTNWGRGEPSLPKNEHCIIYWKFAWADFPCTSLAFFICEEN